MTEHEEGSTRRPIVIDLAGVVIEVDAALPPEEDLVDLANVVATIEKLCEIPERIKVNDYVQRPAPARALRVLEPPTRIGSIYRIFGVSSSLGEEVIYRGHDVLVPIVRGVPMTDRQELALAARAALLAERRRGLVVPLKPGGAA